MRELGGALNRVLVEQELEGYPVTASDVAVLLGEKPAAQEADDFGSFIKEITGELTQAFETEEPWKRRLKQTAGATEFEGFSANRLRALAELSDPPQDLDKVLADFAAAVLVLDTARFFSGEACAIFSLAGRGGAKHTIASCCLGSAQAAGAQLRTTGGLRPVRARLRALLLTRRRR